MRIDSLSNALKTNYKQNQIELKDALEEIMTLKSAKKELEEQTKDLGDSFKAHKENENYAHEVLGFL